MVAAALRMSFAHADALLELVPPTRFKPRLPLKNMLVILLIALFATGRNGFPILQPNKCFLSPSAPSFLNENFARVPPPSAYCGILSNIFLLFLAAEKCVSFSFH